MTLISSPPRPCSSRHRTYGTAIRTAAAVLLVLAASALPQTAANAAPVENPYPEAQITQIPEGAVPPPGRPVPEAAPSKEAASANGTKPVKAEKETTRSSECTGANATSATCYTATQQARPTAR